MATGRVWGFKVHDLVMREGFEIMKELKRFGKVFLDLKFHDIPTTVGGEVAAAAAHGADLITVHASGGAEMLKAAIEAGGDRIVAVTVLTSLPNASAVPALATLAASVGVRNIVCSPHEIHTIKEATPGAHIITPGIRSPADEKDDQKRTMSAKEALAAGADLLVIGRPITKAPRPAEALKNIIASLG